MQLRDMSADIEMRSPLQDPAQLRSGRLRILVPLSNRLQCRSFIPHLLGMPGNMSQRVGLLWLQHVHPDHPRRMRFHTHIVPMKSMAEEKRS